MITKRQLEGIVATCAPTCEVMAQKLAECDPLADGRALAEHSRQIIDGLVGSGHDRADAKTVAAELVSAVRRRLAEIRAVGTPFPFKATVRNLAVSLLGITADDPQRKAILAQAETVIRADLAARGLNEAAMDAFVHEVAFQATTLEAQMEPGVGPMGHA